MAKKPKVHKPTGYELLCRRIQNAISAPRAQRDGPVVIHCQGAGRDGGKLGPHARGSGKHRGGNDDSSWRELHQSTLEPSKAIKNLTR